VSRRLAWGGPLAVFAVALVFFGWLFARFPVLYDTDSYYHLAIARAYARDGPMDALPWARTSLMHEGFGDKELLFHAFLAPFAGGGPEDAARGGRRALALLNALLAGALALFGVRALGAWGLLVPWLVFAGSSDFLGRAIRLRPELLSLLLLLAAIACAGWGRDRLLGLVSALYTLSYTAFHALLGLCFAWFVARGWTEKRWSPNLLLYPLLGAGLGLLVHPGFPHNLLIWKVQSVDFFLRKAELDVGSEIGPATSDELLLLNLAWILGLVALWRAARQRGAGADASTAWTFHVAAAAFGALYLLAQRFSIYFVPLATLALAFELRRRGRRVEGSVALPGRGRLPLAVALALISVLGLSRTGALLVNLARAGADASVGREAEWAAFGRAVPPGARVAAEWGSTHLYMFWAPQAAYLNVLDPVFMALPFPRAYAASRALFEGREPDVPLALEAELASSFLALSSFHPHGDLLRRLAEDPRLAARYRGYTLLYEAVAGENEDFVLDWRVVPPGAAVPPSGAIDGLPVYPRSERAEERALEGFVDLGRVDAGGDCVTLVRDEELAAPEERTYELAPWGPSTLWVDGERVLTTGAAPRAVLGAGLAFSVRLDPGTRRLTVLTCGVDGRGGFYLRRTQAR
jgi:hypothetical protein